MTVAIRNTVDTTDLVLTNVTVCEPRVTVDVSSRPGPVTVVLMVRVVVTRAGEGEIVTVWVLILRMTEVVMLRAWMLLVRGSRKP